MKWRRQMLPNARTESPSLFIVCQVTWKPSRLTSKSRKWVNHFHAVDACRFRMDQGEVTREQRVHFEDKSDWWEWYYSQLSDDRPLWLWCQDLTLHATLLDLWGQLDKGELAHRTACVDSKVGYISLMRGKARSVWIDRRNWFRGPPRTIDQSPQWIAEQVDEVAELWRFLRSTNLGCLRVTASGQSLQVYRHRFGPRVTENYTPSRGVDAGKPKTRTIILPKTHQCAEALELERLALHGGPVHCFRLGAVAGPVHVLDCQSLYPSVMADNLYPAKLVEYWTPKTDHPLRFVSPPIDCIARVAIQTDQAIYPLKKSFGTVYPVGKFNTVLAGPELERAQDAGHVKRVWEFARYELRPLFTHFVNHFWKMRQRFIKQNKPQWADMVKNLMNSLHGKFAQRCSEWSEAPKGFPPRNRWGFWHHEWPDCHVSLCRGIAGKPQISQRGELCDHAFPAVTAFVYSYARLRMAEFFRVAAAGQVYYSAIDSIHCDQRALEALQHSGMVVPGKIGILRIVGQWPNAFYYGPNDYMLGGERKCSGVPTTAKSSGDGYWEWPENECAAHVIERVPDGTLGTRLVRVNRSRVFKWGRVQNNGKVLPLEVKSCTKE